MIKAIIFDCFGVFYVDSHQSLTQQFPKLENKLVDINAAANYGMLSRDEYVAQIADVTALSQQEVLQFVSTEHTLNAALVSYIRTELKAHYKLGFLSNVGSGWMQSFLTKHELRDLFDEVEFSFAEGITKPHPSIYETMARRLGVAPGECIMVDDRAENIAGADGAGMAGVQYDTLVKLKRDLERLIFAAT